MYNLWFSYVHGLSSTISFFFQNRRTALDLMVQKYKEDMSQLFAKVNQMTLTLLMHVCGITINILYVLLLLADINAYAVHVTMFCRSQQHLSQK